VPSLDGMTGLTQPILRDTVAVVCDSHAARSGAVALILDGHGQMRGPFSQYERHDGDEVDRAEDEDWRNPGSAFRLH
jgi:hypothetical protein